MRVTTTILAVMATCLMAVPAKTVRAISLDMLAETNGSIQQGDKVFSNFSFPAVLVASAYGDITVQGVTVSGEHGLRFSGPFSAGFAPEGSIGLRRTILVSMSV
ncbi:MAG: hypothetical protein ACREJU_00080 [Nitrospiraceae bacterium]